MKASELRIGNYFIEEKRNELIKVIEISESKIFFSGDFKGKWHAKAIPITEEWLLNLGFEEIYNSEFRLKFDHITHREIGFYFSKVEDKLMQGFRFYGHYIKVEHVHQLQNLYFALTGEELTLKK
jgi:hypothetical protein